ncbi:MAG: hypothetical protein JO107_13675, partial [Hyphomicrobiales bacterium]|nr:hypothetical protein [Hyphomicrobiales bacterium]
MSVPSLSTAVSQPHAHANQPHDAAAKFGHGEAFSALLSAFAGETAPGKGAPAANSQPPAQGETASNPSQSLEADLEGLVLGALPSGEGSAQESSASADAKKDPSGDGEQGQPPDGSTVASVAPLWWAPAELATAGHPTATAAATKAISAALTSVGATAGNAGNSSVAPLASTATRSAKPIFENAGALNSPQETATTPISFTVVHNRTHLGV